MKTCNYGIFANCNDAPANEPVMDGWAVLKILNTRNHPQREMLQRRVHLVTRTVGARFIELKRKGTLAHELDLDLGGDQYLDTTADSDLDWLEDFDAASGRCGRGFLTDPDEIKAAYEDACQEVLMLKLCNYRVSYHTGLGWAERWPKIGDLVDVPADLHADLETEEPMEDRPSAANHLYDDRWFDNHAPNWLGFDPDPYPTVMTLYDLVQEHGTGYAILGDRKGRSMWEVAVWKLAEYGRLEVRESVQRKFAIKPRRIGGPKGELAYTPNQLCAFIVWAHQQPFKRSWEFDWIAKSIYVVHSEPEGWTGDRPRRKFVRADIETLSELDWRIRRWHYGDCNGWSPLRKKYAS